MWVTGRGQAHVLLYLTELDSRQKEQSYAVFFLPVPKAKPHLCHFYPEPGECADVENLFNFLTQWKIGRINLDHLAKLIAAQLYNCRPVVLCSGAKDACSCVGGEDRFPTCSPYALPVFGSVPLLNLCVV